MRIPGISGDAEGNYFIMAEWGKLVVAAFCLLLFVGFVSGREEDIKFNMNAQAYLYVDKFGFYDQGSASVNVTLSDPRYDAILFSCTQYAWRQVRHIQKDGMNNQTRSFTMITCNMAFARISPMIMLAIFNVSSETLR